MRSLLARNETARFTTISGFKSYIFLINQSFWTGSLCFSNRKYTKIADSSKKSADIHYHVNKNTVLLIWCVALGQYIVSIEPLYPLNRMSHKTYKLIWLRWDQVHWIPHEKYYQNDIRT